jgi:transposase
MEEHMTESTRSEECTALMTRRLYLAFELGSTKWTLGFTTAPAERPRVRTIGAGDLAALDRELLAAKLRFGLPPDAAVRSCYEAGREGFWLHRWLVACGLDNRIVDSSSIEVNRRFRRPKTDRLDVRKLLGLLLREAGGERKVWSVVHVPTPEQEAQRQLTREIETVREDRKRVRNRIQGLLAAHGIRLPLTARFRTQLGAAHSGDGRPLPLAYRERLAREWAHLEAIEARLTTLATQRDQAIATGTDRVATVARRLCEVRAVAETSAALLSAELFGTRAFRNGREIGAISELAPVPYRSDQTVRDQGISKAGRAEIRRVALQLAWGWTRWQPASALTRWFRQRFEGAGARSKRIGIVALARKLLIALWHYVEHGVVPEGATLKVTT